MQKNLLIKCILCLFMALGCNVAWADFNQQWTQNPVAPWSSTTSYPDGVATVQSTTGGTVYQAITPVQASASGNVTVTFTYSTGSHKLNILGVDLVTADGTVKKSDYHHGKTGGSHSNNVYTLNNVEAGSYNLRYFVCDNGNEGDRLSSTNGNIAVVGLDAQVPVEGRYYRFGYDFGGNAGVKYIQSVECGLSGKTSALLMSEDRGDNSIFYVEKVGNNLRIKSLSTTKYIKEDGGSRGLATDGGNATFTFVSPGVVKIQASSYLHANSSGSTYFVDHCGSEGGHTQHNFTYEEVTPIILTVDAPSYVGAQATWNGVTKTLPASWSVLEGTTITNPTLTVSGTNIYTFDGLYEGETSLGKTIDITSLTADRTITAKFTPTFFSSTYGEKWLTLTNCSNTAYVATTATHNDTFKGNTSAVDYANESQLWCFVGDPNSFKIYNKAVGESMQLGVPLTGNNTSSAQGDLAVFASSDATWKLKTQNSGFAFVPTTHANNSDLGVNMWGGPGGNLQLYGTAESNLGSYWTIKEIDVTKPLTFSVNIDGNMWESRLGVADLQMTINGATSSSKINGPVAAKTMYLPYGSIFSLSCNTYRGFTFNGFGGEYNNVELPDGGLNIVASFTVNGERYLYYTPTNGKPYRIPAIATAANGHIFAISDYRPCGNDIGYGEVDIKCRISTDNGLTWGEEFFVADGQGGDSNVMATGFGDAAIVADHNQNKLLVMMVCGKTVCHNGRWDLTKKDNLNADAVNRVARVYATFNNETQTWDWTDPVEVTDEIYTLFLDGETPTVTSMFIGSGKICQSRIVKKNEYYRLYCSMWTRDGGNRVIYSDDFGMTWNVLGTINDRPASSGDEPKVEELPDGRVLLSSRKGGGRYFNIFTFADETYTSGTWDTVVASNSVANGLSFGGNSTNGEIYIIDALNANGEHKKVMLQSIPTGSGRSDVAVYYKEIEGDGSAYTPTTVSQGWTKGIHVSTQSSCYSTMIMQADGRIGFLFEEAPGGYCIVYIPMTVETITGGAYTGVRAANIEDAQNILNLKGVGYPKEDAAKRVELANAINLTNSNLPDLIAAYKVSTEEIQMPEDGKAYNFRSVHPDGKQYFLKYNGSTLATDANATGELDAEKYICRVINEAERKYAFVNAETGKYVIFYGSGNTHPFAADNGVANGFASSYNVLGKSECDWILTPRADLCMGTMSLSTKRNRDGEANFYGAVTYTINNNGGLNANSNTNNVLYNNSHSSLFMIDEVDYENTANFWAITDQVEGADYGQSVSVFSAPFATVIPVGFKAYYAEDVYFEEGSYVVRMVLVNGQALQANQGVVLLGEEGETSALMIPVTTEEFEEISDINKFVPVTEEAQVVQAGNYFFGNGNFNLLEADTEFSKNTAYLHYEADEKPAEFFTIFQSLPTAGIESVTIATDNESAIYDLQGRRVVTPVNGNLYIQNGRKFIQ